jgi:dTMP kinase
MPEVTSLGRLIAICGIDGSGKTTQADLLARRAQEAGLAVRQVSFPRYGEGFFADTIARYLRGEFAARAEDVSPYLAGLPYALDRWQAAGELHRWLAEGALVVCNRYVAANMAHQGSKLAAEQERRAFYGWTQELEYGVLGLPRPRLQVLLDMPCRAALSLTRQRGSRGGMAGGEDIHERDEHHLTATALAYRELAAGAWGGPWAIVRCADGDVPLPPEAIAEDVWREVQRVL